MRLLIPKAPRFHEVSNVAACVVDLSIVTHFRYSSQNRKWENQSMLFLCPDKRKDSQWVLA